MNRLFLLPVLALLACPPPCEDRDDDAPRLLSVNGLARLDVAPDEATLGFTFSTTGKKIGAAHDATRKKVDDFVAAMTAAGVPKDQVELGTIAYSPNYATYDDHAPRIENFTASTTVVVKTKNFDLIPAILDGAVDAGLTETSGVDFHSTTMPDHKKKVRDMAIEATRAKAQQLAQGLGAKLGDVHSIQEGAWDASISENALGNRIAQSYRRADPREDAPLAPGAIPLSLELTVQWELE